MARQKLTTSKPRVLWIRQPWASLICAGIKTVENRKWSTAYRGPVIIGAPLKDYSREPDATSYCRKRGIDIRSQDFLTGGIVGIATLTGCVDSVGELDRQDRKWFQGPYGLVMKDGRKLPFLPMKGQLGLHNAPPALLRKLKVKD